MQGSVSANHLNNFSDRFSEGSVYRMSGFDVKRNNNIWSTIKDRSSEAQRVMLTIRLERDVTVCVSGLFLNLTSGIHIYCDSETVGKEKFDNCQRNKVVKLSSSNEKNIWVIFLSDLKDNVLSFSLNRVGGTGMDMRSTAKHAYFQPENYLSSTGTPVVNVTKATISAMNALSKFPRTNRMLSRNAKLLKRNIRLVVFPKKRNFPFIHKPSSLQAAGNQPFNNNKTVAGKHAEEHTSMRHHNSAAQGGVSNDCTRYVLLVLT
ncbi:hypothetical protein IGI04_019422 [Brassica rapa subsp. trilocularis]|uniref:Uncharacterized protein n=1 Tax=Brassica rapa subsp. trilocularis TaxID=1813537 RepID=A0ABQ7MFS9_BRACM|nr:hypothetical protein IGI04_019422 [Brassica rapa subsp. trilocularis]